MLKRTPIEPTNLRTVAEEAARQAGQIARVKWNQPRQVMDKGFRDIVTDADLASQSLITELIRNRFPEHGFLTEEYDDSLPTEGPIIWIIDPVDGTTNYSRQIPSFCVSIGAVAIPEGESLDQADFLAGVIYDPMRDELFSAAKGMGSTLNGQHIRVSQTHELQRAVVGYDWGREPDRRAAMVDAIGRISRGVHTMRSTGSAALAMAWVAAGRFDIYFNFSIGPWDVAAAMVIVQEAGGDIRSLRGDRWEIGHSGCLIDNSRMYASIESLGSFNDLSISFPDN